MAEDVGLEKAKLELEQKRLEYMMALEEKKLELEREKARHTWKVHPLIAILIPALFALAGVIGGQYLEGNSQLRLALETAEANAEASLALEREKLEGALILAVVQTGDPIRANKNLLFIVEAGLIQDEAGKIKEIAQSSLESEIALLTSGATIPGTSSSVTDTVILTDGVTASIPFQIQEWLEPGLSLPPRFGFPNAAIDPSGQTVLQ